jgi:hypothetical protein
MDAIVLIFMNGLLPCVEPNGESLRRRFRAGDVVEP